MLFRSSTKGRSRAAVELSTDTGPVISESPSIGVSGAVGGLHIAAVSIHQERNHDPEDREDDSPDCVRSGAADRRDRALRYFHKRTSRVDVRVRRARSSASMSKMRPSLVDGIRRLASV